jgi:hypothetical protein
VIRDREFGWDRLAGSMALGLGILVAGCGSESNSPPSPSGGSAAQPEPKTDTKAARAKPLPRGTLPEGSELSAREKRDLRKGKRAEAD